jgi:hypothetical protein
MIPEGRLGSVKGKTKEDGWMQETWRPPSTPNAFSSFDCDADMQALQKDRNFGSMPNGRLQAGSIGVDNYITGPRLVPSLRKEFGEAENDMLRES